MPPDLREIQAGFRLNALEESDADGTPPRPPESLLAAINADGLAPERRLAIHRNHFAATVPEALAGVYEATRGLLGDAFFDSFALRYARRRPPAGPCLFEYGEDLPDRLQEAPGMAELGYVIDVARLEWAMHASFHAPAATPFAASKLAAVPTEAVGGVRLALCPSVRLLSFEFPADELWRQARAGEVDPAILSRPGVNLLLNRPDLDVEMRCIDTGMHHLLDAVSSGATLAEAAAAGGAADPTFDFAAALGDCLGNGIFADQDLATLY